MTESPMEKREAKILYVEDELIVRATMHKMLLKWFTTIYLADNGKDGLDLFLRHRPDIVITDARMPGMDGLTMSRAIRAEDPHVPIIFVTAYEDANFIEETKRLGITRNIIKPITIGELLTALENIIGNPDRRSNDFIPDSEQR
jgi:YesN/AraC family two-component response regulator